MEMEGLTVAMIKSWVEFIDFFGIEIDALRSMKQLVAFNPFPVMCF